MHHPPPPLRRYSAAFPRPSPVTQRPDIDQWLADFYVFVRQCGVPGMSERWCWWTTFCGCAKEDVLCHPDEVRRDFGALVSLHRRVFGPWETVTSLYAEFYSRMQSVGETLAEFSRTRIRQHHGHGAPGPGSPWRRRSESTVCCRCTG